MSEPFKDRLEMDWGFVKLKIKAKKEGTLIYLDERPIEDMGVVRTVVDDNEKIETKPYLIFDIPVKVNADEFEALFQDEELGLQIRYFAGWTEVASFYPQCLDSDLLRVLEKKKYIRVSLKEYSFEEGKSPAYINAKGVEVVYNLCIMMRDFLRNSKGLINLQSEHSNEVAFENTNEKENNENYPLSVEKETK